MRRPREPRPWPRERRHGTQSGSARPAWCALIGFAVVCALAVNARHMLRLHAAAAAEREGGLLEAWRAEARDAWTGDAPWPRVVHSPRPTPAPSTMQAATEEIDAERAAAARAEAEGAAQTGGRGARGGGDRAAETPGRGRARGGRAARARTTGGRGARRGRARGGGSPGGRTREEDARAVAAAVTTRDARADAGPLRAAGPPTPAPVAMPKEEPRDRATPAPTPDRYEPRDRATPAPVAPPKKARARRRRGRYQI